MDCLKSDTFLKNFLFAHVLYLYVLLKTSKYPSVTTTCCGRYYFIFFYLIIFSQSGHFFLTFACIIYFIQAGQIKPIRYSLISSIFDKCPGRLITSITAKPYILQKPFFFHYDLFHLYSRISRQLIFQFIQILIQLVRFQLCLQLEMQLK